jgi:hypothetical protein
MTSQPKILLIDATILFDQYSNSSLGLYFKSLMSKLLKIVVDDPDWDVILMGYNDIDKNFIEIGLSQFAIEELKDKFEFISLGKPHDSTWRNYLRWNKIDSVIYEVEPSIYFSPNFERGLPTTLNLKHSYVKTRVATYLEDVLPLVDKKVNQLKRKSNFRERMLYNFMLTGVENSDLVIVPSKTTKSQLLDHTSLQSNQIQIIKNSYNPILKKSNINVSESDKIEIFKRFGLEPKSYLVTYGGLGENVLINEFVAVIKRILEKDKTLLKDGLFIISRDFYKGKGNLIKPKNSKADEILKLFKKEGIIDSITTSGILEKDEHSVLLSNAKAYISFSSFEGFPFWNLGAMASHVPVITNQNAVNNEILKLSALNLDLINLEEDANTVLKFLKDDERISANLEIAKSLIEKLSWDKTAEKTWHAIKSIV